MNAFGAILVSIAAIGVVTFVGLVIAIAVNGDGNAVGPGHPGIDGNLLQGEARAGVVPATCDHGHAERSDAAVMI